jgi:hypothetical protein
VALAAALPSRIAQPMLAEALSAHCRQIRWHSAAFISACNAFHVCGSRRMTAPFFTLQPFQESCTADRNKFRPVIGDYPCACCLSECRNQLEAAGMTLSKSNPAF